MKEHLKKYTQALVCAVTCPPEMVDKFTEVACKLSIGLTEDQITLCQDKAESILAKL